MLCDRSRLGVWVSAGDVDGDEYDISGISIARMDEILERDKPIVWKEQLDAYNERVIEQVTEAARGQDAIVHLGWNTRDENWR